MVKPHTFMKPRRDCPGCPYFQQCVSGRMVSPCPYELEMRDGENKEKRKGVDRG